MNATTPFKLRWLMALAGAAMIWTGTAHAVPSTSIKECAQADLYEATKDKKKAKQWRAACKKAIRDIQSGKRAAPPKASRAPRRAQPVPQVRRAPTPPANAQAKRRQPPKVQAPAPKPRASTRPQDILSKVRRQATRLKPPPRRVGAPAAAPYAAPAPMAAPARRRTVVPVVFTRPAPVDPRVIEREKKAKQEKAMRDATLASLASDTRAIGEEHANVFGITLGEALVLPVCDALGATDKSDMTCLEQDRNATRSLAMRMADAGQAKFPRDMDFDLVRLGREQCPNWIGSDCYVSVVTKSGFVVGVSFFTSGKPEKDVAKDIEDKYGQPQAQGEAVCSADIGKKAVSRKGSHRSWSLPRLSVNYAPLAGRNCDEGRVQVETATLSKSLTRPPAAPLASNDTTANPVQQGDGREPKM